MGTKYIVSKYLKSVNTSINASVNVHPNCESERNDFLTFFNILKARNQESINNYQSKNNF